MNKKRHRIPLINNRITEDFEMKQFINLQLRSKKLQYNTNNYQILVQKQCNYCDHSLYRPARRSQSESGSPGFTRRQYTRTSYRGDRYYNLHIQSISK